VKNKKADEQLYLKDKDRGTYVPANTMDDIDTPTFVPKTRGDKVLFAVYKIDRYFLKISARWGLVVKAIIGLISLAVVLTLTIMGIQRIQFSRYIGR
jgi:hypothetical protein